MMAGSLLNADIDRKHRSTLFDAEPGSLKHLITRTPMSNWMIHPYWLQRLKWAGLLPFVHLVEATHTQEIEGRHHGFQTTRMGYDGSLLTCLVDRWRPETHTFHFRWGEMAPILQDVSYLLGLPLAGVLIGPVDAPENWAQEMAQRFYGIHEGAPEFTYENHGSKFDWLQNYQLQRFGYPDVLMTAPQITRSLEAYLLWLLGKVMFTENHVSTISACYIRYAREIAEATCQNDITQWSWRSAVLAATYREQVTRCYPAFSEQFDTLKEESVIWEPYTTAEAFARYPGGLSIMCRRDEDYWLTKSKIIFDCQVEEMSQQRVMRQFGLRQMVDPPSPEAPLSLDVHMYSRKGTKRSANQWLQRVNTYINGWQNAIADVWTAPAFDMELFHAYLQRYMSMTRLRPVHHAHDDETYPSQSTMEPRQSATDMTWELQNEVNQWERSLSSAPLLLPRQGV
uniref:Uncharacterized protein n=1 Tax=Avena sativa TaxID=4498 RepID=A0ACD5TLQ0_AVESA